jgi:hypothetical protein
MISPNIAISQRGPEKRGTWVARVAVVLVVASLAWSLGGMLCFAWSLDVVGVIEGGWKAILICAGVMVVGQALLLCGAPHWTGGRPIRATPMFLSMLGASLIAGAIFAGLVGALVSIVYLITDAEFDETTWVIVGFGVSWLGWGLFFAQMDKSGWRDRYRKMYLWLVRGTVLELAVTVPVDVMVRRKTDCYCEHGSFVALAGGIGCAGILFGPGVVLLMLRRRTRWLRQDEICFGCGYDVRATTEPRCPECGRPFPRVG